MIKSDRFGFTVEFDGSSKKAFATSMAKACKAIPENATDIVLSADDGIPDVTYQIMGKKPTNRQLKIRAGDTVIVPVENGDRELRVVESTWEVDRGEWMVFIKGLGRVPLSECQPTHIVPLKG